MLHSNIGLTLRARMSRERSATLLPSADMHIQRSNRSSPIL